MNAVIPSRPDCENCTYWNRTSETIGECHADPPKIFLFPIALPPTNKVMLDQQTQQQGGLSMIGQTAWPQTAPDGWCGAHPDMAPIDAVS